MKHMNAILRRLLVVMAIAAMLLAACGEPPTPEATEPAKQEEPTVQPTEPPQEEQPEEEPTEAPPTEAPAEEEQPAEEPTQPPAEEPPAIDGVTLLEERCTQCHGLERTTQKRKTREEWEKTVVRMVNSGANLTEDELEILIDYLAETYGP
jgi:cytochrome c5